MNLKIATLLTALVLALSCQQNKQPHLVNEEFDQFYYKYHSDTLFQLRHTKFPVQGRMIHNEDFDTKTPIVRHRDGWMIHTLDGFNDDEFVRTLTPVGDDLVVEEIIQLQTNFKIVRRWEKVEGKWFLIYYATYDPQVQN